MKKWIILGLVALLAVTGAILGYHSWYQSSHVFVGDTAYEKELETLDLRGTGTSMEEYETIRRQLPDCEIRYDLPFQGGFYPDDTRELTITSLTDEEVELLDYLPALETVQAEGCRDYAQLLALQQRHPGCELFYSVELGGESYPQDTREMAFDKWQPTAEELKEALTYLPQMEKISIHQPEMPAQDLRSLQEAFPEIVFTWQKDAFGTTYSSDVTEIELEHMYFSSLDEVEAAMAYYPNLEKVALLFCGYDEDNLFDDETMAAFREKMRPEYKVVWAIDIYKMVIRTDDLYFMPNKYGLKVSNYQLPRLRYCEDMLCVDLGHHNIVDLSFVEGMPHLKYFICIDSNLLYIDPLSTCKELVYCELFWTPIADYTPLLGCTALEDLNVARTKGDPLVFKDMPWLKNLYVNGFAIKGDERAELEAALPNTKIVYCDYELTANGWRDLPNYFAMRDLLGMPYNRW